VTEITREDSASVSFKLEWVSELPKNLPELKNYEFSKPNLDRLAVTRAFKHVDRVIERARIEFPKFGIEVLGGGKMKLRTANSFPHSAGIASSASSFSALTLSAAGAICRNTAKFKKLYDTDI